MTVSKTVDVGPIPAEPAKILGDLNGPLVQLVKH